MRWTKDEIKIFEKNWQFKTQQEMQILLPSRTISSMESRAHLFKLKKDFTYSTKGNINIKKLLKNNHQILYFIGLILSDGCYEKYGFRINLTHFGIINELSKILNTNINKNKQYKHYKPTYNLNFSHRYYEELVAQKFDIKINKTYNPPTILPNISNSLLMSLLIGIIEGDGSSYYKQISITHHILWKNYLISILNKLKLPFRYYIYHKRPSVGYISIYRDGTNKIIKHIKKYNLKLSYEKWYTFLGNKYKHYLSATPISSFCLTN